jgi:hypothetical protein
VSDVFLGNRLDRTTHRCNISTSGRPANKASTSGALSRDGNWAVFNSGAANLVSGDTNGRVDLFARGPRC